MTPTILCVVSWPRGWRKRSLRKDDEVTLVVGGVDLVEGDVKALVGEHEQVGIATPVAPAHGHAAE